jgi:two-component system, cell cycle response regulator
LALDVQELAPVTRFFMTKQPFTLSDALAQTVATTFFDHFRLIDPEIRISDSPVELSCDEAWNSGKRCSRCLVDEVIQNGKPAHRLKSAGEKVQLVVAYPVLIDGKTMILEGIKDLSATLVEQTETSTEASLPELLVGSHHVIKDSLTQVFTGHYLFKRFPLLAQKGIDTLQPLSIMYISLNNIIHINNTYGNQVGNYVLQQLAKVLVSACDHPDDFVVRYHGLRFILVLNQSSDKAAFQLSKRLNQKVSDTKVMVDNKRIHFSINVGTSTQTDTLMSADDMIRKAQLNVVINNQFIGETPIMDAEPVRFVSPILSTREKEVANLLLEGLPNLEIAKKLFVTEITVKKHISSIYNKLLVNSRAEFISKFRNNVF